MVDKQGTTDEVSAGIAERVRQILFTQALLEGGGVEVANRLRRSPHLTAEERDFAGDVLRSDEVAHLKWALAAAEALAGQRYRHYGRRQRRHNEEMYQSLAPSDQEGFRRDRALLLTLTQVEYLFFRSFNTYSNTLAATLPEEFRDGIPRLKVDEAAHISWGQSVALRFQQEGYEYQAGPPHFVSIRNTRVHRVAIDIAMLVRDLASV